jgi:hypothetical protein
MPYIFELELLFYNLQSQPRLWFYPRLLSKAARNNIEKKAATLNHPVIPSFLIATPSPD